MNSKQEDHYAMYLKVDLFLVTNAADLAFNPSIAGTRTALNTLITAIAQSDSTATRNITGYTAAKNEHRTNQLEQFKKVRAGLLGYYTANPDIKAKTIINFTDTDINEFRDPDIFIKTDQLLDLALPIKALLVPYGVTAAEVDMLQTLNNAWPALEPTGRMEEAVNKAAGEDVERYLPQVSNLLANTLDSYMKVVEYNDPNHYSQYLTARMIDDSGGNSGTEGYEVTTTTVPAGASVIIPVGGGTIPPDLQLYLRVVSTGGGVFICTTNLPASPCTSGYELKAGNTFKDTASALGIDLSLPNLQVTNPGLSAVTVRTGVKIKE